MSSKTPSEIVSALDRHIVGQEAAKRAVAVAVRNRWRRMRLSREIADEITPRNIVMIGPTGVGKTEIARRLAQLVEAPFIKVEATKFTEVGYVGRDVESMVRDLLETAIKMIRDFDAREVASRAEDAARDRVVSLLLGEAIGDPVEQDDRDPSDGAPAPGAEATHDRVRAKMRTKLDEGFFDDRELEIMVRERPTIPMMGGGNDQMEQGLGSMLEKLVPETRHRRTTTVARAIQILAEEETEKLVDQDKILERALERTEQSGIIFIDEIDKIAISDRGGSGEVSRQGVQRDLLPIVEGCAVNTKHGIVHTDNILFIAAGAFQGAKVSDLMPELQGRFPIRVELEALTREDFRRILLEPHASLTEQQAALLSTEELEVTFEEDAIDAMADLAAEANERMENIGARRLMTIMEQVFEEIAFDASEMVARGETRVTIDGTFVREKLAAVVGDEDLGRFVL
ncbi:MAG: ATP-dependent protease ATPase subunit HslU [Planctomycetota bacterium]|nr:ATP-dependent protease ATPase subunit HslU [Planctomycetota bacterium]MEC9158761.1 ATP-dependent protease ATPase subunit HslU [Planctomycetota bacterium]MED5507950.1 ATP-dependent protease ATPase subunit HslU [Planctomycetota bacterium]